MNKAETKGFFNRLHKANTVYQEHEINLDELEAVYMIILDEYAAEVSREECIKYLEFVVDYCDEIIYGDQAESYYEAFKEQEEL